MVRKRTSKEDGKLSSSVDGVAAFLGWLDQQIDDEEYYSGGPIPVSRLKVLREVRGKAREFLSLPAKDNG